MFSRQVLTIATDVAAKYAAAVDAQARFPREVFAALKSAGVLSAPVPAGAGGPGCSLPKLGEFCATLATECGSSGLILAMHFAQVACICRSMALSDYFHEYAADIVRRQLLLASVASEKGTSGDARKSVCALQRDGSAITLTKEATTASYAEYSDGYLITCRRDKHSEPGDQLLVLFTGDRVKLTRTGSWDTLGMRGTCGPPYRVVADGTAAQILPEPYAQLSSHTVVPVAHVLWAAVWEGIARGAVDRAIDFARQNATPGGGDARLGQLASKHQMLRALWQQYARKYVDAGVLPKDYTEPRFFDWALEFNALKMEASRMAHEILHEALQFLGVLGYKNDSSFSIGRGYRDLLSASIMVSNERLRAINGQLSLFVFNRNEA